MTDLDRVAADMERRCKGPACFGHLRYVEAPSAELVLLPNKQFMNIAAARAFLEMSIRAHVDAEINLLPAHCFRSLGMQRDMFLHWAKRKDVGFEQNLRRVAPAGYSEHHTGYGVDVHDGPGPRQVPDTPFQTRPAYAWLVENAHQYDFENSFPRGNVQGIVFEPWHWRWVGNAHAEGTFRAARKLAALDKENPQIGEALRAGQEDGIGAQASPAVRQILADIIAEHAGWMQRERERVDHAQARRSALSA